MLLLLLVVIAKLLQAVSARHQMVEVFVTRGLVDQSRNRQRPLSVECLIAAILPNMPPHVDQR